MFLLDLMWAFLLGWLFTLLLTGPLGWRHPARAKGPAPASALFLFVIFFLAIWAGGVWLIPFGPTIGGGYWLPFLVVGLFVLLVVAALSTPSRPPRGAAEAEVEAEEAAVAGTVLGVFFWILLLGLVGAVVLAYLF